MNHTIEESFIPNGRMPLIAREDDDLSLGAAGVNIEGFFSQQAYLRIRNQVFVACELNLIEESRRGALLAVIIFSAKQSLQKYMTGLNDHFVDFLQVEMVSCGWRDGSVDLKYKGREFRVKFFVGSDSVVTQMEVEVEGQVE